MLLRASLCGGLRWAMEICGLGVNLCAWGGRCGWARLAAGDGRAVGAFVGPSVAAGVFPGWCGCVRFRSGWWAGRGCRLCGGCSPAEGRLTSGRWGWRGTLDRWCRWWQRQSSCA